MTDPTPTGIIAGRNEWLAQLERDFGPVGQRLMAAYESTLRRLEPYRSNLTDELVRMADAGVPITPDVVRGIPQWGQLLAQIEIEMNNYARLVEAESALLAEQAITSGVTQAEQLTASTLPDGVTLDATFIRPQPEALQQLIDYVDSDAMRASLTDFGANAAQNFADMALTGFAQGKHPVTMASKMVQWFDLPFAWAENTLRTSYLWSYRAANHLTYAANDDLLDGWMWWSARDARTCRSCWSQHGKMFSTDQVLNDHHRGRCTPLPVIKGATWPNEVLRGPELFATLPEADQLKILGPSLFEVYKQGKLPWSELSKIYNDDIYGDMLGAANVGDILKHAA